MATTVERNRRAGAKDAPARAERTGGDPRPLNGQRRPIIQARSHTADGSRPLSAGSVVIVGIIVYVIATLLNSAALVKKSNGQLENAFQGTSQEVAENIDRVAGWLFLDRPGEWAQDLRANDAGTAPAADAEDAFGQLDAATDPSRTAAPGVPNPGDPAATTPGQTTVPTAPTLPPGQPVLRVPTDADPLRVYVAGDSLVGGWGAALENIAGNSTGVEVELDYEVSTGLVRTDYYNWPARLQQKMEELDPEVVILGFGGNDKQQMEGHDVLDPEWQAVYRQRVGAVMDYVNQDGRKLIWVGTPNYPDDVENQKFAVMNEIFKTEAAKRPNITYVDTWARFASPNGSYAPFIANEQGEYIDVRAEDGFHLNVGGVNILGGMIMDQIQAAVAQYSQAAPGTATTPTATTAAPGG